jgi:hypothetical protein
MAPDMKQIRIGTLESRIQCMERTIQVLAKHYRQFETYNEYRQLHTELAAARDHCLQLIRRIEMTKFVQ